MSYEEEFESQYNEERRELADLEYSAPIEITEIEEIEDECTCDLELDDLPCPVHSKVLDEE
jgi:hypothetical protein